MIGLSQKEIVIPGELLDDSGELQAGSNTYKEGSKIFAQRLGLKRVGRGQVEVVALSGRRYEPQRGDLVIGTVAEVGPSNWYLEINAPSQVGMHVNEVPWRVDFGETADYLAIGDTILLKVYHVDEMKNAQVTMKDRACRKLEGGTTIQVQPSKVPRIIGRGGSMIATIKERTDCRIFVGKNGIIWIDGEPDDTTKAITALRTIEREAHTAGLTDRIADMLGAPRTGRDDGDDWAEEGYETPLDDEAGDDSDDESSELSSEDTSEGFSDDASEDDDSDDEDDEAPDKDQGPQRGGGRGRGSGGRGRRGGRGGRGRRRGGGGRGGGRRND